MKRYTFHIEWSEEDQEYAATVAERPSLSWLAKDPQDALADLIGVLKCLEDEDEEDQAT